MSVAGAAEAREALDAAFSAFDAWSRTPIAERAEVLERVAALLSDRAERIGRVLAEESGKLLSEAVAEVGFAADYFEWFAHEAPRCEQIVVRDGRQRGPQIVARKPAGLAASLTPWNFPVSIQARKVAPALAAGCTVVARPSLESPLSVVQLFGCLEEAGVPSGVANLVIGPAREVTDPILEDPRVRVLSFTGSTQVGKALYQKAAGTVKRLALELGGCAPFIVCRDADIDQAVAEAVIAKFRNCGQSCVAANCFYVEEPVYEAFLTGLAERINAFRVGDPLDETTTLGPLINPERRRSLEDLVDRATKGGFREITRGPFLPEDSGLAPDCFMAPTLLAAEPFRDLDRSLLETEIFGPVAFVVGFSELDDLMGHLARNPLGLAGYVFSRDVAKAMRVGLALETGIVGINEGMASAVNAPMGGVKESGLGREGGRAGLEEFLEVQYLAVRGEPVAGWSLIQRET